MKKVLITGSAGFIGSALSTKLLKLKFKVIGIDNHNNYYSTKLKADRIKNLKKFSNYRHYKLDICNQKSLEKVFKVNNPQIVVNLAAQAGVRYSIENPYSYIESNIVGFNNILENCRNFKIKNLVYASSSSVYGANTKLPFSENDSVNHPLSLYAASKRSNELMAHAYSYLYNIPTTALRFFTVYGPWGRPDMALFKFTKAILEERPLDVYNYGKHTRDFTYINDIIDGIIRTIKNPARANNSWNSKKPDPASSVAPWRIYNIGNNKRIKLLDYIEELQKKLNKKAIINFLPLQTGDVQDTCADISNIKEQLNYKPSTSISKGVSEFVNWYKDYYQV